MNDNTKQEAIPPAQRPRSPRVPVNFTVELEGKDAAGEPFQASAEAVRVSRGGATLITELSLQPGTTVRLTPPFGRSLDAEVNGVWMDETDGRQRIGVKLLDPNGWFAE
ncbi:MAG: PilZ domain-containing protein [Acidobacteria bacterium]|nr:PilZ domain-containing protein [Acidobacteriota bacterium]